MGIWTGIKNGLEQSLGFLEGALDGIFGDASWGWAIIALTLIIRVLLLPLAVKQTRSMKGMQELQPQVKAIQKKYKVDRDLMRKDPQAYRDKRAQMNEEVMGLYKEAGVNPASGCLPLLAQAPIFFALFQVLRDSEMLKDATFYFFTSGVSVPGDAGATAGAGLGALVSWAGWPGWLLIVLMAATMFITQKQMMARSATDGAAAQQQKIMLYVMPVFLAAISFNLPIGVLLYWVTTNIWQAVQQLVILREVEHSIPESVTNGNGKTPSDRPAKSSPKGSPTGSAKGSSGNKPKNPSNNKQKGAPHPKSKAAQNQKKRPNQTNRSGKRSHLPGGGRN